MSKSNDEVMANLIITQGEVIKFLMETIMKIIDSSESLIKQQRELADEMFSQLPLPQYRREGVENNEKH